MANQSTNISTLWRGSQAYTKTETKTFRVPMKEIMQMCKYMVRIGTVLGIDAKCLSVRDDEGTTMCKDVVISQMLIAVSRCPTYNNEIEYIDVDFAVNPGSLMHRCIPQKSIESVAAERWLSQETKDKVRCAVRKLLGNPLNDNTNIIHIKHHNDEAYEELTWRYANEMIGGWYYTTRVATMNKAKATLFTVMDQNGDVRQDRDPVYIATGSYIALAPVLDFDPEQGFTLNKNYDYKGLSEDRVNLLLEDCNDYFKEWADRNIPDIPVFKFDLLLPKETPCNNVTMFLFDSYVEK